MTVFDLPQVSKIATQKIRESGFQNQIDVKAGSFLSDQIPIGYDLITLIRVLYDHSDDNVSELGNEGPPEQDDDVESVQSHSSQGRGRPKIPE